MNRDRRNMIYLASPYSHPDKAVREERYNKALECTKWLMKSGVSVFSPIVNSHFLDDVSMDCDFWVEYDKWFLERCDCLFVLRVDGWEASKGVAREIALARELKKPIFFIAPDGDI